MTICAKRCPCKLQLAYSSYLAACILVTDATKMLDPHLENGVHKWRNGKRFVKSGDKLSLEDMDTLVGSVVTLDKCVRNSSRFAGCSLSDAIRCATHTPARCLGR